MSKGIYKSDAAAQRIAGKYAELLRHWPLEREERDIDTRHGRSRVIVSGKRDNPPLLLFHPANINSVYWLRQVQAYAASHRVYAVDLIGEAGGSAPERPRFKGPALSEWLEDLANGLELERTALVGASLGAWMCLRFACNWPERVERLALISPPGIVRQRRARSFVGSLATLLSGPLGSRMIYKSQLRQSGMEAHLQDAFMLARRQLRQWGKAPRFSDRELGQLYCPVLLIVGGRDPWFDSEALTLRAVRAIPQLEVNFRSREGHFPSDFTREVDRFLVSHYARD